MSHSPVFVALDTTNVSEAAALAARLKGLVGGIKIGMEFFYANGPAGYEALGKAGLPIFLDLKLHDIPNTIAQAARTLVALDPVPAILTVHAANGPAGLHAVAGAVTDEAAKRGVARPKVVAVTVLTSLDDEDLRSIGVSFHPAEQVLRLAALSRDSGLDGVVCSPMEVASVREAWPDATLVVPGIRPKGAAIGDQKRVMGPLDACRAGASVLVIGRPITKADDPVLAARAIADELASR